MINVNILKNWETPNILRQTPKQSGVWGNYKYSLGENSNAAIAIVLNEYPRIETIRGNLEYVLNIKQEPELRAFNKYRKQYKFADKVIIQDKKYLRKNIGSNKYILGQCALPWHINKTYDELCQLQFDISAKNKVVSTITSTKEMFPGHRKRLLFLDELKKRLNIDHFGRGINEIDDKWDGLYPYKYSVALENYAGDNYWTEKIADCFLAWTIPIYFGASNIYKYFPEKSIFQIDLNDPYCVDKVVDFLQNDDYTERIDALKEARELVLKKYNFFNVVSALLDSHRVLKGNYIY